MTRGPGPHGHLWRPYSCVFHAGRDGVMRLGGWKDIKSVIRYMHVNVDELRNTIDRLPGGNLGDTKTRRAKTA
jgi:hypothetical protein